MDEKRNNGLSRRSFIGGAAVVTAGAAGLGLIGSANATENGTSKQATGFDYDVIVVGGGFAGATAARECGHQGYKTLLLEARSRLGGRTFTSHFAGQEIEFGGAWVHWLQPHVWSEMQRYGLGVVEDPLTNLDKTLVMYNDGSVEDLPPEVFGTNIQVAFEKMCHDAWEAFPRPHEPMFTERARKLDKMSVLDRINQLELTRAQRAELNSYMALYGGETTDKYGLPGVLKLFACGGWNYNAFMDTETHYRIEGGTIGLINAMLADSGAEVRLNMPVISVEQLNGGVRVETDDGETITAGTIIMTVPLNTYRHINFTPALSEGKQRFIQEGQLSKGAKLYVHVKENLGRVFAFADEQQPLNWVQTHDYGDELGTILSITIARAETIDVNDRDAVTREIRKLFPGVEVLGIAAYDWTADPFSLGAWAAYGVGQLSRLTDLQQPEGRILFAGAETSNGWHANIDGAVESGLRAGREAKEILG
ncbi:flavin monoamine oxidase family protein [Stutzerimonas nitrititolerans]|uniref:flavin monoamine oxidase family protein n=1 Tax=Stutzerimonas nitrititolerans TaxID=2482751 RepID=UPI0028A95417|nr:NAD(P)/FAD-dependent oxidoreductase [Stutzerimonas nitrititolerans]